MKTTLRRTLSMVALASGLTILGQAAPAACSETSPAITIPMHNYARVAPRTLAEAEEVTTGIFREAGLETRWADSFLNAKDDPEPFAGHLLYSFSDIQLSGCRVSPICESAIGGGNPRTKSTVALSREGGSSEGYTAISRKIQLFRHRDAAAR